MVIFIGTWGLLHESVNLALDAVPEWVDMQGVQDHLTRLQGVESVHDLHVWAMSTTETALTAHLIIPEATFTDEFLDQAAKELHDRFGIEHTVCCNQTMYPPHPYHATCGT